MKEEYLSPESAEAGCSCSDAAHEHHHHHHHDPAETCGCGHCHVPGPEPREESPHHSHRTMESTSSQVFLMENLGWGNSDDMMVGEYLRLT